MIDRYDHFCMDEDHEFGHCDVCGALCDAGVDGRGACSLDRSHDAYSGLSGNLSFKERMRLG